MQQPRFSISVDTDMRVSGRMACAGTRAFSQRPPVPSFRCDDRCRKMRCAQPRGARPAVQRLFADSQRRADKIGRLPLSRQWHQASLPARRPSDRAPRAIRRRLRTRRRTILAAVDPFRRNNSVHRDRRVNAGVGAPASSMHGMGAGKARFASMRGCERAHHAYPNMLEAVNVCNALHPEFADFRMLARCRQAKPRPRVVRRNSSGTPCRRVPRRFDRRPPMGKRTERCRFRRVPR
ncbi:hypothetical protein X946_3290 [Burkholderia sp. ABCPW 111]|nr:hypothetical protein X946_3290 [Burkholderia sp. ABCPW 111]